MTYEESAALMGDIIFRNRIKVACLKFADSILLEAFDVPAHNTRIKWAQDTFRQPDMAAQSAQPGVVMDPAVQTSGSGIEDTALQGATEATVNKML